MLMRRLVTSYLDDFLARGNAITFAHRRGLRTVHWSYRRIANSAFAFADLLAESGVEKNDRVGAESLGRFQEETQPTLICRLGRGPAPLLLVSAILALCLRSTNPVWS
jgi:hypothetical protein